MIKCKRVCKYHSLKHISCVSLCRRVGPSLSVKKDRRVPFPSFADMSDLDQITVYREARDIIRCSPLFISKSRLFNMQVTTTINGYFEEDQIRRNAFGMRLSKFQLGNLQGLSAKSQENNACWQIGWIVIKAPATLRTWNRHHLAVHKVTCFVWGKKMCQNMLSIICM